MNYNSENATIVLHATLSKLLDVNSNWFVLLPKDLIG